MELLVYNFAVFKAITSQEHKAVCTNRQTGECVDKQEYV